MAALILASTAVLQPRGSPAFAGPALRYVPSASGGPAVAGSGWGSRRRVLVTVQSFPWTEGVLLRTTAQGQLRVGVRNVDDCSGLHFAARDFRGHQTSLPGPSTACPAAQQPPQPHLAVLRGKRLSLHVVRLLGPAVPSSVTMSVGEALYLWEPGSPQAVFSANADQVFLSLLRHGPTPPRACAQIDCSAGVFWEWVAMRAGQTIVDLSPACRQVKPPCGRPDLAIEVTIRG